MSDCRKRYCLHCAVLVALLILSVNGSAVGGSAVQDYQQANKAYVELSRDAARRKVRPNWINVIKLYTAVAEHYSDDGLAPKSLYKAAKLYEQLYGYSSQKGDLNAAIDLYARVADKYPESSLADDSLYRAARIHEKSLDEKQAAYALYRKVITQFPQGDMVQQSREALNAIHLEERPVQGIGALALVRSVRQWSTKDYTRIVIDLDRSVSFNTFRLPPDVKAGKPHRLVVDLNNSRTHPKQPYNTEINDGVLSGVRVCQNQTDTVRVVLDLKDNAEYNAFPLENPARLVVDIRGREVAVVSAKSGAPKKTPAGKGIKEVRNGTPSKMPTDVASIAKQLALKVSRIVIDPGHGGKDPGAIGRNGEKEKDVTLAVGKLLSERLKAEGFEVFLTREGDAFVPLEERTAFANKKKADLFISLHVNANRDRSCRGIETYFLNLTTDETAIEVAARENSTSTRSLGDLQMILNDLMLNSKINESSRLAGNLQDELYSDVKNIGYTGKNRGVRQAPFYVLLGAQMPAVLIELGFMTNTNDCQLLGKDYYQQRLVDGVAKGINAYIRDTAYAYNGGAL